MQKRLYWYALACILAIPAVVVAGGVVFVLIDPELARGSDDYARNFRLLQLLQRASIAGMAGLALILWIATCLLVLKSRRRSLGWLALAAAGPLGFPFIAMLRDLAPLPGDRYQQFIRGLAAGWRMAYESAFFVVAWTLPYALVVLKRNVMIAWESFMTGTPAALIIEQQTASSGMWAAGEMLEECYLVVLLYLLWPVLFNLAGWLLAQRSRD